jgi:formylglycine-generating enzyme
VLDADAGTCGNKTMDGDETDTDCGGAMCPKCSGGRKCKVPGDCASNNCDGGRCATCPIGMVRVPVGPVAYCIDATEVTNAEYDAFVAKVSPKSVAFPAQCKWKATGSFVPSPKVSGPNQPVRNVDWCDAWAYCDSLGNRLCGMIGTGSTKNPAPFDKYDDPNVDQWRHACSYSPAGTAAWPYGPSADATKCNTIERAPDGGSNTVVTVRSLTGCIGDPTELNALYDMSGNVAEWQDSCQGTTGANDNCRVRGGSFRDKASAASCGSATTRQRDDRQDWVGFRCCRL